MKRIRNTLLHLDWWLVAFLIPLLVMSVLTMSSFGGAADASLAVRQSIWLVISITGMVALSSIKLPFLRQSNVLLIIYGIGLALLTGLIFVGSTINGSTSWYSLGAFSFQPSDMVKLIVILILAKYLARRHVEIKAIKHVFITALYVLVPFLLIFIQPDFGSAAILLAIWLGMILVSGISKKHILILLAVAGIIGTGLWVGVFEDYQKDRIISFLNPLADTQGAGYNAYQSTIAVGSGQLWGKGVGYGTQSRLHFLPEYETDFIFAAVAEEWGFIGSLIIVILLLGIIIRILILASRMNSNFELLFAVGLAVYFLSHAIINIGMNIGLLPVTGVTLPFLSYGGSHLLIEFAGLGILMSFARNTRNVHSETKTELFLR